MQRTEKKPKERGKSSTLDVLGGSTASPRIRAKWAKHCEALTRLRDRLVNHRNLQSEEAREEYTNFSLHMADAGTDSYDRDWSLAMASSSQSILYEIDEALNRIRNGTYGTCELTGQAIEQERLIAIPWTRFSKSAQAELEARGAANRTQLGELGSYMKAAGGGFVESPTSEAEEQEEREAA